MLRERVLLDKDGIPQLVLSELPPGDVEVEFDTPQALIQWLLQAPQGQVQEGDDRSIPG